MRTKIKPLVAHFFEVFAQPTSECMGTFVRVRL